MNNNVNSDLLETQFKLELNSIQSEIINNNPTQKFTLSEEKTNDISLVNEILHDPFMEHVFFLLGYSLIIILLLSLVFLFISGFIFIFSNGDTKWIQKSNNTMRMSIIGISLSFLSFIFLIIVAKILHLDGIIQKFYYDDIVNYISMFINN